MPGARSWIRLIPIALLVTALLAGIVTWLRSGAIESDLTARSQTALAAAGLPSGTVSFSGRDATLSGFPPEQATRALDVVQAVDGVGAAGISGDVRPAGPPPGSASPPPPEASPSQEPPSTPPSSAAPPTGKAGLQAEIDRVLATTPITFTPDSARLTAQGTQAVREVAKVLAKAPDGFQFRVGGHAARGPGGERAALRLSQDRARTVAKLLQANGVPQERVTAQGYGDTLPAAGGNDRRAEITVEQG
ncbi:OmpA family protein [Amycolatopsis sp. NPDC059021]|uniref:OmpA family protein n=1 Tax=Amycolatopsis sp. NPDC059021 TaxID=3346704 RepID=UPI00366BC806